MTALDCAEAGMKQRPFSKKTDTIEVRVAPEMKQSFMESCEQNDCSASDVLRLLMANYVSAKCRASNPARRETSMFGSLPKRVVRLAVVTGTVASLGIMSAPSTAADSRLEALFHWFDRNGDGALTDGEFFTTATSPPPTLAGAEVMLTTNDGHAPSESADDVFSRVDTNGDGRIMLREMTARVGVHSRLGTILLNADQDASNSVSAPELAARITEARAAAGAERPAAGAALMAEGLLAAHDANGDGQLTAGELAG